MKKTLFVLLCLLISLTAARGGDKITTTNPERLPVQARKFLSEHFSDTRISVIKIEPKGSATTYDVLMENGVAVAFNHKGMWTEMDAKVGSVPQSAIPADLLQYARDRFPGCEYRLPNETVKIPKSNFRTVPNSCSIRRESRSTGKKNRATIDGRPAAPRINTNR